MVCLPSAPLTNDRSRRGSPPPPQRARARPRDKTPAVVEMALAGLGFRRAVVSTLRLRLATGSPPRRRAAHFAFQPDPEPTQYGERFNRPRVRATVVGIGRRFLASRPLCGPLPSGGEASQSKEGRFPFCCGSPPPQSSWLRWWDGESGISANGRLAFSKAFGAQ